MLWKISTLNSQALEASAIYLLNNGTNAERYLKMHRPRL
ncbi:YdhR family protein [Acinetobacter sp. PW68]|nr:YdhR family protein [Acinetobacter sp. PW68]